MRHKMVLGVLVLVISFGFNVYQYLAMTGKQETINNIRGHIIVSWAREMSIISYYPLDATTNDDVDKVRPLLYTAGENIAMSADVSDGELYFEMAVTSMNVYESLMPYAENSSQFIRIINPAAVEMIRIMANKIGDTVGLLIDEEIELTRREGTDPIQLLKEKGILDQVISGLADVRNQAGQIYDFTPKFQ